MGARSRSKRRRGASAGGADLISGLCDDVLVRILELLPDAGDAVRTGALSRRWRGLWTRLSSLTFDSGNRRRGFKRPSDHKRFLAFVNDSLAQHAMADDAADLEHLAISFAMASPVGDRRLVLRSTEAAQKWIRHATRIKATSLVLKLRLLPTWKRCRGRGNVRVRQLAEPTMIDLSDLPSSEKLETMHCELGGVRLRLPAAAVFVSLVDLSIENIALAVGTGHLLARLLSSVCCPSLQKLQLRKLSLPVLDVLLIEASALLELSMSISGSPGLDSVKLKTPSLRILHFKDCDYLGITLGISAPKLEELTSLSIRYDHIEVDGGELPCVGSLKVELRSLGYEDDDNDVNDGAICLLRCCTSSLTCLEVSLHVTTEEYRAADIISGRIPHLPHVLSLTVHVQFLDLHSFGVGLSDILKQCSYLKYLCVHSVYTPPYIHQESSLCDHADHWKSHQIYSANIQEVSFTGLAGTDCESSFIQQVLAHAAQLQKVALVFDPRFNMTDGSGFIPCSGGTWVCHDPSLSYEWSSDPIHK